MNDDFASVISPTEIRFERLLPGPIETVWVFLTDSQKRGEWLPSSRMDLRVGGKREPRFKHSDLSPNKAPPPERFRRMDATGHRSAETKAHGHVPPAFWEVFRQFDGECDRRIPR